MQKTPHTLVNDKGVTAIVVALLMTVLLGIASIAVDIGYMILAKNELQRAADAAALAGARALGEIYKNQDPNLTEVVDNKLTLKSEGNAVTIIKAVAYETALANKAAGANVDINYQDADDKDYIKLGNWDPTKRKDERFTENNTSPTVVQVKAENDNIATFFARIFGRHKSRAVVDSTAALTPICKDDPPPFGISGKWIEVTNCGSTINWNSTQTSCAGWTTLNINKNDLDKSIFKNDQDIMIGLMGGNERFGGGIPAITKTVSSGPTVDFTGGALGNELFEHINNVVTADGPWTIPVIVYDNPRDSSDSCKNPGGALQVSRFATVTIYGANVTDKSINAKVACNFTDEGRGCGTDYSGLVTYGDIPSLIE
jgi:Flp pilus assembly protein TadG